MLNTPSVPAVLGVMVNFEEVPVVTVILGPGSSGFGMSRGGCWLPADCIGARNEPGSCLGAKMLRLFYLCFRLRA